MTPRLLRTWRILGGLVTMTIVLSGCSFFGKEAVRVVMKIAEDVLVTAGSEFVHQLISGDADADRPTVTISYQNRSQQRVAVTYAVDNAKAVSVSGVEGSVEITGNGKQTTVRVQPPSTATIEIIGTDQPVSTSTVAAPQQVTPEQTGSTQDSTADLTEAAKILSGTWQGTYRCAQGLTGLRLVLYPTSDGTLLGTFNFYAADSNPGVPSGQYAMRGTYSQSSFDLKGDYWIHQPAGYGMVDLSGNIPGSASDPLTGRLAEPCKTYDLAKVSAQTSKPPV